MPSRVEERQALLVSNWMDREGVPIHGIGIGEQDGIFIYHDGSLDTTSHTRIEAEASPYQVTFVVTGQPTAGL